jgi:ATP-binding cassette subfamily B multidrug efflux pump
MSENKLFEKFWQKAESIIDPFSDAGREVLPGTAWRFILHFAQQAKMPFILLLVVGGLSGGIDAALYWSIGWLIDLMDTASRDTFLAENWLALAGLAFLLLVVRAVVMIASAIVEQQVIVPQFFQLVRWQSFRRVIEQPYGFYQNDFAGRIATKVMQGGEAVGDFIVSSLQALWSFVTFLVLAVGILTSFDVTMGVVLAVWALGYLAIVRFLLPKLRMAGRRTADERSNLNGRLVDAFTNIVTVKLFDSSSREHGFVRDSLERFIGAVRRLTRSITAVRTSVALLNGAMMTAIAAIAVFKWTSGGVSTGEVAATMGLVFRLNQMSGWMMFNINGLIRNFATVQDAIGTISVQPGIADAADAREMGRVNGDIRFENVTFHYGAGKGVIDDLNLRVAPGERIALVGPSGAGKTTIVNLLLRLFDVEAGRILLDGQDIRSVTQASLRAQFGVVTQEPMLMHRSIRDNIAYGRPDATMEEIVGAARKAKAHEFIEQVRDPKGRTGYEAHVGERGVKLSGGQRQRIAIARMMLKNAPILILDEATSSLDSEIEAAIQDNLENMMAGKTVIAVAHRLSTIAALDRLIVVENGRIVEQGSHAELIARSGLYSKLWQRQSGGFLASRVAAE